MSVISYSKKHYKLYFSSILIGLVIGIIVMPYRLFLNKADLLRGYIFSMDHSLLIHVILIIAMWALALLIYYIGKQWPLLAGSGIPQVEGFLSGRYKIKRVIMHLLLKLFGSAAVMGMGISLGSEGPIVQSGSFVASFFSKWFKIKPSEHNFLITSGAAAGLSAIFTAPLAATVFANETIAKYQSPKIILTVLLAAIPAAWIARSLFPFNPYELISTDWPDQNKFYMLMPILIGLSLFMAISGVIFNYLVFFFKRHYGKVQFSPTFKIFLIVLVTYICGLELPELISDGEPLIYKFAKESGGVGLLILIFVLKMLLTTWTYSVGFPGGVFLPILVMGAMGGKLFVVVLSALGLPLEAYSGFFMLISIAAFFTASAQSPITALILIPEMTGHFNMFFPMTILIGLTFLFTKIFGGKPIYEELYNRGLPHNYNDTLIKYHNKYRLFKGSSLIGLSLSEITLPTGAKILNFERDNQEHHEHLMPLKQGDIITVSIESPVLENLHRSLLTLCKY